MTGAKNIRAGILGGGQLARMLVEAAQKASIDPVVFASSKSDPAAAICSQVVIGDLKDEAALQKFFEQTEVVTFESDFLPFDRLQKFSDRLFVPELRLLFLLSDKLKQKKILQMLRIPTADFEVFEGDPGGLEGWLDSNFERWKGQAVVKWARGGYDGKGVNATGEFASALDFAKAAIDQRKRIFVEQKISFKRELALVSALSIEEEFTAFPLVVTEQKDGICYRVFGAAQALGISTALQEEARKSARRLAAQLELYGVFAVEFFEDMGGKLFVNELAPRVHNSGHFSLDASDRSQFDLHWTAILGRRIFAPACAPTFGMLNLLAPSAKTFPAAPTTLGPGQLTWYGKAEAKPGRKMGHINFKGSQASSAESLATIKKEMDLAEKAWLALFK